MGAVAKREAPALTELQARFVELLLQGVGANEAKVKAGYTEATPTISILRGKAVEFAIRAGCDAELNGPMRVQAMLRLKELITNKNTPAATAFNAAKLIIERGDDDLKDGDKPLTEMTLDELEELIRRKEGELQDVTPKNGA